MLGIGSYRSVQKANYNVSGVNGGGKSASKSKTKKSPTRIQRVFRRVQSKPDSLELLGTSPGSAGSPSTGAFFAQQLTKICSGDQLPQPIIDMLVELRNKGERSWLAIGSLLARYWLAIGSLLAGCARVFIDYC